MDENEFFRKAKSRFSAVRGRTLVFTIMLIVGLIVWGFVNITFDDSINIIDFLMLCAIQISVHIMYYPDGEINEQKKQYFVEIKNRYNEKAIKVNQSKKIGRLREYCKVEHEERKEEYVLDVCGKLDITLEELQELKTLDEKRIKNLKQYEFVYQDGSSIKYFSKTNRKILYDLIFKENPMRKNNVETIMSGTESPISKHLIDKSKNRKKIDYLSKLFIVFVIGAFFAYVMMGSKDGISIADIAKLIMYFITILTTGITAFSAGEKNTRENKSKFYVDLSNFIDAFEEWDTKTAVKVNALQSQVEEKQQIEKVVD